jgi:hypothetical protein
VRAERDREVTLNLGTVALLLVLLIASSSFARSVLTIAREFGSPRSRSSR